MYSYEENVACIVLKIKTWLSTNQWCKLWQGGFGPPLPQFQQANKEIILKIVIIHIYQTPNK